MGGVKRKNGTWREGYREAGWGASQVSQRQSPCGSSARLRGRAGRGRLNASGSGVAAAPGPGRLRRVYANAGRLLGGKIAAALISVIYLGLVTRVLGPANYGVLVLISFYVLLVGSFCVLQGWHTLVRYGGARLVADDTAGFQRLFAFTARVELISGVIAMAIAAGLSHWAGRWVGWPDEFALLAALYSLAIFTSMHSTPSAVLNLFGRFDLLSLQQIASPLVRLAGAGLAWWLDAGLRGFLIAWLLGSIAEGLTDWVQALHELRRRGLLAGAWRWPSGVGKEHPGIWRFLLTDNIEISVSDAANRITPLVVGAVLTPAAVGLYHLALRIGVVMAHPVNALSRTLYPELAVLTARGDERTLRRLVLRTGAIAMAGGIVFTLIFAVFGEPLLRLIGGPGFEGGYRILLLVALARTVDLLGFPFSAALVALGRPQIALWINLAALLALLPVLYLLLAQFDVIGAGLHAIAYALVTVVAMASALLRRTASAAATILG